MLPGVAEHAVVDVAAEGVPYEFVKRPELRVRVFDLASSAHIVNILPAAVDIEALAYRTVSGGRLALVDDDGFSLDINEFGATR